MMNAIIIDDELNGIKGLELLLSKFTPDVKVAAITTNPREGIKLINQLHPEIVFLDIYMPELNGFDLLKELNSHDFYLVFTTAYEEYGLRALKANAFDYLLKPIDWEELKKTVEKIKTKKSNNNQIKELLRIMRDSLDSKNLKIILPNKTGVDYVLTSDIIYVEAQLNHCVVYLQNGRSIITHKTLKEYQEQLCITGQHFFRIQNSFIINLDSVVRYTKEDNGSVTMSNGQKIPVSKFQKKNFLQLFKLDGS